MAESSISFDNPAFDKTDYEEYPDENENNVDANARGSQTDGITNQKTFLEDTENFTPAGFENQNVKEKFYKNLKSLGYVIDENAALSNKVRFVRDPITKQVYAEYRDVNDTIRRVQLTYEKDTDRFLSLNNLSAKHGVLFVRTKLGVKNYSSGVKPKIPLQIQAAAMNTSQITPTTIDNIEMQDLSGAADRVNASVENLATEIRDVGVDTDLELQKNARNLERAHKFINTLSGQIKVAALKISTLDEGIVKLEIEKESEGITPEEVADIDNKIQELKEQRDTQRALLNDFKFELKSQFTSIRETITTMLYSDRTLGERVRTLFREQGITIVSVLTALGFAITTLAEAIALGVKSATPNPGPKPKPGPGPKPGPTPKPTPGSREWIKQTLQKIANLLIKLGDKALAALPSIIGAVVNFLLKSAASAVEFLAGNLWTLIVAIGGLLYVYIAPLTPQPNQRRDNRTTTKN